MMMTSYFSYLCLYGFQTNLINYAFLLCLQIDYSEPWIIGLIFFHIIMTLFTLVSRKRATVQALLFFVMCKQFQELKRILLCTFVHNSYNMTQRNWEVFDT